MESFVGLKNVRTFADEKNVFGVTTCMEFNMAAKPLCETARLLVQLTFGRFLLLEYGREIHLWMAEHPYRI